MATYPNAALPDDWLIVEMREAGANARLIAAAPGLLEALRPFDIAWLDHPVLTDGLTIRLNVLGASFEAEVTIGQLRAARAAIAKAEGRT